MNNEKLLNLIGSSDCRKILKSISRTAKSVQQIINETKLAQTSTYRNINKMVRAKLLIAYVNSDKTTSEKIFKTRKIYLRNQLVSWAYDL